MLELSGEGEYTLFLTEAEPDSRALTEAFASLYKRGLLVRDGNAFIPGKEGEFFSEIRSASFVTLLQRKLPNRKTLLCYGNGDKRWLAELIDGSPSERYRLSEHTREELAGWLQDAEYLSCPVLQEADVGELEALFADDLLKEPESDAFLRISRYSGNGELQCIHSFYTGRSGIMLCAGGTDQWLRFYTQQTLYSLLRDCFGG